MKIFISYARGDRALASQVHDDLERGGHAVWLDVEVDGGQVWWDRILAEIRACQLLLFVLSPDSATSRACTAELSYAVALHRRILPVIVRDVDEQLAPEPLPSVQAVDYRFRTAESAIELLRAVGSQGPSPLPDPLPEAPAPPMASIGPMRDVLAAASLTYSQQLDLFRQLRERVGNPDDREHVVALLHQLRGRSDVVEGVADDIDTLLASGVGADERRERQTSDLNSLDLLRSLVTQIGRHHLTPILGWGLTDSLVGPRRQMARSWAQRFEFPMAPHQQEDLPQVARFVAAMTDVATLRESLEDFYRQALRDRYPQLLADRADATLADLAKAAWERLRATNPTDVHTVLAKLPCAVYVTAHPTTLMADALRLEGKEPHVELCRWRPDVYGWPTSVFERDSEFVPSPERPLVFHLFGSLDFADSLVITEDDYIDFAIAIAENPSLIPLVVRDAVADSALLLLGFGLDEWDVRVLLRSLVGQQGARRLRKYTHVAAQVDLREGVISPDRARRYLERYFGKFHEPSIDIFWGSVDEFADGLAGVWEGGR